MSGYSACNDQCSKLESIGVHSSECIAGNNVSERPADRKSVDIDATSEGE